MLGALEGWGGNMLRGNVLVCDWGGLLEVGRGFLCGICC